MTGDHSPPSTAGTSEHWVDQPLEDTSSELPKKIARVGEVDHIGEDEEEDDQDDGEENQQRESIFSEMKLNTNPRLQRYLVAVEYIGTRFSGAQQQSNARTVVGVLQDAFHKFIGQPVSIFCSSRTDAGVHALSNVCHVDVERISKRKPGELQQMSGVGAISTAGRYITGNVSETIFLLPPHEPAVVKRAVNHFLQKNEGDIMVIDVRCVPSDFHSRYKAQERTYFYRLLSGPEPLSTFEKDRAWHVSEELDLLAMQKACKVLVGHHDFSSFRAAACQAKSPIRTLDELNVTEVVSSLYFPSVVEREQSNCLAEDSSLGIIRSETEPSHASAIPNRVNTEGSNGVPSTLFGMRKQHRCFVVTARARSFLYHQVRLLVGVLKSVGTGDLTVPDVERILKAKTVSAASPMAPACGLYLGDVKYDLPSET